jgi:NAD(P)H dehydrogenase (quinone)
VHNGLLRYNGFDVLQTFAAHMPGKFDDMAREDLLCAYDRHLRSIDRLPRVFFDPRANYGPDEPRSGFQHP